MNRIDEKQNSHQMLYDRSLHTLSINFHYYLEERPEFVLLLSRPLFIHT